jgi:hypothetical protein
MLSYGLFGLSVGLNSRQKYNTAGDPIEGPLLKVVAPK